MANRIPFQNTKTIKRIQPNNIVINTENKSIVFSFEKLDRNEFFNLDGTCVNWASDLVEMLKKASGITMKDIYSGKYSGKNSTFRIHTHEEATPPCNVPNDILLDDLWQIRISLNKGGIHGVFVENVFYVLWLDPQHNMYPNKNRGGLVKIKPPSTCCKERDEEINTLKKELDMANESIEVYKELLEAVES